MAVHLEGQPGEEKEHRFGFICALFDILAAPPSPRPALRIGVKPFRSELSHALPGRWVSHFAMPARTSSSFS